MKKQVLAVHQEQTQNHVIQPITQKHKDVKKQNLTIVRILKIKKALSVSRKSFLILYIGIDLYIIPPIPPIPGAPPIGGAGCSSFSSTITVSVVRNIPAIEAAFSRATRVTFAGSITPAS